MKLRKRDFLWQQKTVHIGPLKRQAPVRKTMLSAVFPLLKSLRDKGKCKKRSVKQGALGVVNYFDVWNWPQQDIDYLFPSMRSDAKEAHRGKDTVCKAISRLRKTFQPPKGVFVEKEKIRSHSGRHRSINDMKNAKIRHDVAMKFARIADVRTFMGYGELTDEQTGVALEKSNPGTSSLGKPHRRP